MIDENDIRNLFASNASTMGVPPSSDRQIFAKAQKQIWTRRAVISSACLCLFVGIGLIVAAQGSDGILDTEPTSNVAELPNVSTPEAANNGTKAEVEPDAEVSTTTPVTVATSSTEATETSQVIEAPETVPPQGEANPTKLSRQDDYEPVINYSIWYDGPDDKGAGSGFVFDETQDFAEGWFRSEPADICYWIVEVESLGLSQEASCEGHPNPYFFFDTSGHTFADDDLLKLTFYGYESSDYTKDPIYMFEHYQKLERGTEFRNLSSG